MSTANQHPELFPKPKAKRIRTMSPDHVNERIFKSIPIDERFRKLVGDIPVNFSTIIGGKAKSGKSSFSVCFAQALAEFGKVLYISSEELISKSLQDRIRLNKITSSNIRFAPVRTCDEIELLIRRIHPKFIFVDSVQDTDMNLKDFRRLKDKVFKNKKSWHIVTQTENSGKMMVPQGWKHATDAVIELNDGLATSIGRFESNGHLLLFERRKATPD